MMEFEKNPNPTKDQHFMVDQGMLGLIYETAKIEEGESIVEIGGGEGALTDYLAQGRNYVTVIEKDPYYAAYLKNKYAGFPNVVVIEGDALTFDFSQFDRVVANLPYTITEPFLINLASTGALDYNPNNPKSALKSITLVLSQNSTRKMVAPIQITEGKSRHVNQEFGIMGAICKAFCDVDIVSAIPSEAFYPEPAVTSFVVNLTPKKEKTTVDRIMREFLIDKKNTRPSIQRVYQLMLSQGKVYKTDKHKNNLGLAVNTKFTSSNIANRNIYDLTNMQISQLVQDLVRNDISIKSRNSSRPRSYEDDMERYFKNSRFGYIPTFDSSYEDEFAEDPEVLLRSKSKYEKKYDYLYDSRAYAVLLHRGLEHIDPLELQAMLKNSSSMGVAR